MIEPRHDRIDGTLEVGEVHHPAQIRVDFPSHGDFPAERMAVHPQTLVSGRHIREKMGSLESEVLDQLDQLHNLLVHQLVAVLLNGVHMATNYTYADAQRSLGNIIKDLTADLSTLFRSEIALLKLEIRDMVAKLGGGTAMFAGALFLGLFGIAFLFVTIVLGLVALGVPAWLSALIVTLVLFAAAVVLAMMGKKKFAGVSFVPTQSVEQIKTDIESIKADIARMRSK